MSVPKDYKMVVKDEIPNQKKFTTRQISKQTSHNMSGFKSKTLQRVGFCFKRNILEIRFCTKMCIQKITF